MPLKGQGKTMELALRIIKPFVGLLNDLSNMPSTSTFVEPRVSTSIAGLAACTTLWLHKGWQGACSSSCVGLKHHGLVVNS